MTPNPCTYLAIDLSKATLAVTSHAGSFCCPNTPVGFARLARAAAKLAQKTSLQVVVVVEATGGYERPLLAYCAQHELAACCLNPARVRAFARSEGCKAKTDRIDAQMLLRFAEQKQLRPLPAADPDRRALADLLDRRAHYCEHLAREKNRRQKCTPALAEDIDEAITWLEQRLACLTRRIEAFVNERTSLRQSTEVLTSVKGVGNISAWTILAYLHEITQTSRAQIAALAGIAPYNRDSGQMHGHRRIEGGRAKVRRCLYMAATTAATFNPIIAPYVANLKLRGKPHKVAITAAMRKLLIHLQHLLKKQQLNLAS